MLPTDRWGVGSYRVLNPGVELARRGHDVFVYGKNPAQGDAPLQNSIGFTEDGLIEEGWDADVYVFQRRFEWWIPSAIRMLRRAGKVVVGETDDLYDGLPDGSPARVMLEKHARVFSVDRFNEGLFFSDAVTVSTPALAEHYGRYNADVRVLPNFLDWELWRDVPLQHEVERPRVRVGWMGWLSWRGRDLEILKGFMRDWLLENPHVEFVSIGEKDHRSKTVHDYLRVPREQRRTVPGVPYRRLPEIVPSIDIGLVPLERSMFNECKSHLKGLEYSACGIVPVATASGPYKDFIEPGVNGFLCETADDWVRTLDLLVGDDAFRRRVGAEARRVAARNTIQEHAGLWEDCYCDLVSTRAARSTASIPATSTSSEPVAA